MSALKGNDSVQARTARGINILLGLWLIASPWVFDYSGRSAVLNNVFVGALIATLAALRLACLQGSAAVTGTSVTLGFWTIVSPWTIGYVANKPSLANNIMVGVFVMALAIWNARATEAKPRSGVQGH
jgi:flagellar biosynthesis protein FliR